MLEMLNLRKNKNQYNIYSGHRDSLTVIDAYIYKIAIKKKLTNTLISSFNTQYYIFLRINIIFIRIILIDLNI